MVCTGAKSEKEKPQCIEKVVTRTPRRSKLITEKPLLTSRLSLPQLLGGEIDLESQVYKSAE
jgi:TATA-box binding protein (TBP) (component of TFIID and TFIIIB)